MSLGETLLGLAAGLFGTGLVDFFGVFGGVGQDGDIVVGNFQEPTGDKERFFRRI